MARFLLELACIVCLVILPILVGTAALGWAFHFLVLAVGQH